MARVKRTLGVAARLAVALLGLAYIIHVVDWTDRLELPAGRYDTLAGDTLSLGHATAGLILSGDFDPANPQGEFLVDVTDAASGASGVVRVSAASLPDAPEPGRDAHLRPGLLTTLRHAQWRWLALGLMLVGPVYIIAAVRWWLLLRARGLAVSLHSAFRLSMVGCFFNYCMPGSTGGDLVRAYYAAQGSGRRPDAVMTVIIDRVAGLLGLMILAGVAGCFVQSERVAQVMAFIWAMAGLTVVLSAFYFSRRLREVTGLDRVMARLFRRGTFLGKIEQAASAYAHHKGVVTASIAMSLTVHSLIAVAGAVAGYALGMQTPLGMMLAVIPVLILVAALPVSYQGFGFMEVLGIRLLAQPGVASANQIVVMLLLMRLFQVFYSVLGAGYLLRGDIRMHPPAQEGDTPPINACTPSAAPGTSSSSAADSR